MKKYFLMLALGFSLAAVSQKLEIPKASKAAFEKAHPAATKVTYEKEAGNYEVNFVENEKKKSVVVDAKGTILETEIELKASELPINIQTYMKEHYKNSSLKDGAKITKADGTVNYEAAIKGKDVIFDASGKFIKESKD
jgi:hypothetical protein